MAMKNAPRIKPPDSTCRRALSALPREIQNSAKLTSSIVTGTRQEITRARKQIEPARQQRWFAHLADTAGNGAPK